jgi:hypothetical protein
MSAVSVSNAKVWNGSAWVGQATSNPQLTWYRGSNTAWFSTTTFTLGSVSVAPSATAHEKGAWTPIIASTAFEADVLTLLMWGTALAANNGCALGDIGIGPSGAEEVLVANVGIGNLGGSVTQPNSFDIPIKVPAGSRLSFRWQSARASANNASVNIMLGTADFASATTVDTLGADTATSTGTAIAGVGAAQEIVASASRAYRGFVLFIMNDDPVMQDSGMTASVGIGPQGAETFYRCSRVFRPTVNEQMFQYAIGTNFVNAPCPQGSRVSVVLRDSQTQNWATGGAQGGVKWYNVVLVGVPA